MHTPHHATNSTDSARRVGALRDALGPGFAFIGPSEATLCHAMGAAAARPEHRTRPAC